MSRENPSALIARPVSWKWESDENSVTIENGQDGGVWINIRLANHELLPQMFALITRTIKETQ